tara:strand:- start:499 stop:708 length:210 start_codon:yes stop_codon:yes gene_type:complete
MASPRKKRLFNAWGLPGVRGSKTTEPSVSEEVVESQPEPVVEEALEAPAKKAPAKKAPAKKVTKRARKK